MIIPHRNKPLKGKGHTTHLYIIITANYNISNSDVQRLFKLVFRLACPSTSKRILFFKEVVEWVVACNTGYTIKTVNRATVFIPNHVKACSVTPWQQNTFTIVAICTNLTCKTLKKLRQ